MDSGQALHDARDLNGEDAYRAFHDLTPDGFMMLRPMRDTAGRITDFRITFVNKAAARIMGQDIDDVAGATLLERVPGNRDEGLIDIYAGVFETGETWQDEIEYVDGNIAGWFRITATRTGDKVALSFSDITEVRQGSERLANLIDNLLSFVGVVSTDGVLEEANEPAVQAAGVPRDQLIGQRFWDCHWWSFDPDSQKRLKRAITQAASGDLQRYDAEIRVGDDARLWIDFQLVPVKDRQGRVTELIASGVDITERKRAESHRELLLRELSHRVKNTLATIQSIAGQTVRSAASLDDFRRSFAARLRSIAASHDLLVESEHQNASLAALIQGQVHGFASDRSRIVLEGDDIELPGDQAHGLGLILHELATNASKYGALSNDAGRVTVSWSVQRDGAAKVLKLEWAESDGPPVTPPTRQGFGTRLIERSLGVGEDDARIDYHPSGVHCRLALALS